MCIMYRVRFVDAEFLDMFNSYWGSTGYLAFILNMLQNAKENAACNELNRLKFSFQRLSL